MDSYGQGFYTFGNEANASQNTYTSDKMANASQNVFINDTINFGMVMNNLNTNMDNMDFSMSGTGSMFNSPEFNSTGDIPHGFQPTSHMGSQYMQPNPLMGAMKNPGNDPSLTTMGLGLDTFDPMGTSNTSNAFGFPHNGQHTMQAFGQHDLHQNQATFMGLGDGLINPADLHVAPHGTLDNQAADNVEIDALDDDNSFAAPYSQASPSYPSPESVENTCFPMPQEQATGISSEANNNTNINCGQNITFTSGTTQPSNTVAFGSTPHQVISQPSSPAAAAAAAAAPAPVSSPVSAPAPAGPAKRGRKRKASSDPEPETATQGKAQKRLRLNSCQRCRRQKTKCDGGIGKPCSNCNKAGKQCIIDGQDHRTKQTNLADIADKLERKHYLAMECMCLIIRVTGTKARFENFKALWKGTHNATQALYALSAWNGPPSSEEEKDSWAVRWTDAWLTTREGREFQVTGLRQISNRLKAISEEKAKVKDMRPLKEDLKRVAHWVLAEAYRALDKLSQQDANIVVGGEHFKNFLAWTCYEPHEMDLSDNKDASNKNYLKAQTRGQKLVPTYLKGVCGNWEKTAECMNLAKGHLTSPTMAQKQLSRPVVQQEIPPPAHGAQFPQGHQPQHFAADQPIYVNTDNGANNQGYPVTLSGAESMPNSNSAIPSGQPSDSMEQEQHLLLLDPQMQHTATQSLLTEAELALEAEYDVEMTEPQPSENNQEVPSDDQELMEKLQAYNMARGEEHDAMVVDNFAEQSNPHEQSIAPSSPVDSLFDGSLFGDIVMGNSAEQSNPHEQSIAPGSPVNSLFDESEDNSDDDVDMDSYCDEAAARIGLLDEVESDDSEMSEAE
ncbi:hypothetical protein PG996_003520 [Apiospora saccharicola]|uniref:Zn(2)-C6 fungal-type domain-containing protein n=1 Tax=Apiospora saccharicola TaxID=335842 RepID=A0ABR1W1H8_9PEZI